MATRQLTASALKLLNDKFKEKQLKLPSFSLRAFAKHLKISPTALSEGLRGHRNFTEDTIRKMAIKLQLNPHETAHILATNEVEFELLDEKTFESISDWEYLTVLNLTHLKGFQATPEWISRRTGISPDRAAFVLNHLVNMGYIFQSHGKWQRIQKKLHSSTAIPITLITKCLNQDLEIVRHSFGLPVTERDSSAITLVLTKENFREAQVMIRKFRIDLAALSEKQGQSDIEGEVYKLCIHLVPLSKEK